MAVKNLVSLAWLRYHGVVDTSLPFRERTYPIIYMIFRYSHRKGPEDLPTENEGLSFQDIFFSIAVWSYCWQVWKIQSKKNHANLMKHAPILRFVSILTQKKHIPVKKRHFQNCVFFCCFFGICFFWPFGWVGMLLSLTQSSSIWPGVAAHPFGISEFLESGKFQRDNLQLESVFLYPNFIPTCTCGETLGIILSWFFIVY